MNPMQDKRFSQNERVMALGHPRDWCLLRGPGERAELKELVGKVFVSSFFIPAYDNGWYWKQVKGVADVVAQGS